MPNKTIYVKDTDLPLLEQAQEQLGDSVSSMFAEFLRERVANAEAAPSQHLTAKASRIHNDAHVGDGRVVHELHDSSVT